MVMEQKMQEQIEGSLYNQEQEYHEALEMFAKNVSIILKCNIKTESLQDMENKINGMESCLDKILLAHKNSSVDWDAMRAAEKLLTR